MATTEFSFDIVLADTLPRGTVALVRPLTHDEASREQEAVYVGFGIWIRPKQCGVILNVAD